MSNNVTPASRAASMTARVPSRSTRMPKLLQPRPTIETSGPSVPNRRVRMARDGRASAMRYRRLGPSELEVSEISLGSWLTYGGGVPREQAEACVAKAFEVGINFVDTANVYSRGGAEELLGEFLANRPRDSYVLATKLFFPMNGDRGLSRPQVFKQLDASLARLRTDYVDLYQCHRYDFNTPLEETMEALTEVVRRGKVRYIGFSEWPPDRIQGALTGKYRPGEGPAADTRAASREMSWAMDRFRDDDVLEAVQRLQPIADGLGITMAQLALAWVLREPNVASAIIGASRAEQVEENAAASGVELDEDTLRAIDDALVPVAV